MIGKPIIAALLALSFSFWGVPAGDQQEGDLERLDRSILIGGGGWPGDRFEEDLGTVPELGILTYWGNTTGASHWLGHDSGDHLFRFTVQTVGDYQISLCPEDKEFDTCIGLYRDAGCTDPVPGKDGYQAPCSHLEATLDLGNYWMHVEGYAEAEGPYVLRVINTSVPLHTKLVLRGGTDCLDPGDAYRLDLVMDEAVATVNSGRISLGYDSSRLELLDFDTGDSPFTTRLSEAAGSGMVHCELTSDRGVIADSVLASLNFTVLEELCPDEDLVYFRGSLPATQLEDRLGQALDPELVGLGERIHIEMDYVSESSSATGDDNRKSAPDSLERPRASSSVAGHGSDADRAAVFYSANMDSDPGWTTEGLWAFGAPTGGGGVHGFADPTSGYDGSYVYGYNLSGDYENSLSETHLTSTAINCSGQTGVSLSFYRWLGVETSSFDHAYVRVSNDGSNWTTVWENTTGVEDSSWSLVEYDISAVADNQFTVYLRWTMGTTDGSWEYCGWNIDNVALSGDACDVTCSGTPEGEVTCYDDYVDTTNGGCNSTPHVFGSVGDGETICGTYGTHLLSGADNRDTDWYEFTVSTNSEVTWTVTGEGPTLASIVDSGCTGLDSATADPCNPAVVTLLLPPGTYYGFVATSVFTGVTCGAEYEATLSITEVTLTCADFLVDLGDAGACPLVATGNTEGAFDFCGNASGDAYFSFNVTTAATYTISLCGGGTTYNSYLRLYDDICCGNQITYNDDYCGVQSQISPVLAVGTYYVQIEGYGSDEGDYRLSISNEAGNPCMAGVVDLGTAMCDGVALTATGSTSGATDHCGNASGDAFYKFTAGEAGDYTISLCGSAFDTYLRVYGDACCCNQIYYNDDNYGACGPGNNSELTDIPLVPGTYYVHVEGYGSNEGDYALSVSCPAGVLCVGPDTCDVAEPITLGYLHSGSTENCVNDYDPGAGGCTGFNAQGPDHVYELVVADDVKYDITMTMTWDGSLYVVTDCADVAGTCVAGSDSSPSEEILSICLTAGTYYVIVDGFSSTSRGDYTLIVNEVADNSPDISLTVYGGIVDDSCQATVTFGATVTDDCCVAEGDVGVSYAVTTGNATASNLVLNKIQVSPEQVNLTGSLLISSLTGCPATVQITVDANDCQGGNPVSLSDTADVTDDTNPVISDCPGNISVNAMAPGCTAEASWTAPTADDNCSLASFVSTHNPGDTFSGVTTVTYTATDACDNIAVCSFDVTVEPVNEVLVDLQLFGDYEPGPFTRCISFELHECGGTNSHTLDQVVSFSNGLASATLLVPCGLYNCISARDGLHSLRRTIGTLPIAAGKYEADFTTAAGEDLLAGNLLVDDWIDILDYGIFAVNFGATYGTGDTTCATEWPHADISGNGIVDSADFAHFQTNFLMASETPCCGTPMPLPPPVVSISVGELVKRGLGELAVADLNQDGVLDQQDMTAFMQGKRPRVKPGRNTID